MEQGKVPPNWEELSCLSTKSATNESVDLALKRMSGQKNDVNKDGHLVVWEDNQSCIAMATSQKFTPWTKHIPLKYHHFKQYVESGKIQINYVHTELQQANIPMKPVKIELFPKLCYMLMGW
jgi:hypothetical protein